MYLEESRTVAGSTPVQQLVELDEGFHLRIADMAGNSELRRMLVSLNERIRFIRWIDMENVGRDSTQHEHQEILQALTAGTIFTTRTGGSVAKETLKSEVRAAFHS